MVITIALFYSYYPLKGLFRINKSYFFSSPSADKLQAKAVRTCWACAVAGALAILPEAMAMSERSGGKI
jgi:hypothetical protein